MRLIIAGGRHIPTSQAIEEIKANVSRLHKAPKVVLSGEGGGVDLAGEVWAKSRGVPVEPYPADWDRGKKGGPERNARMVATANALLLIWDGKSDGSWDVLRKATDAHLEVVQIVVNSIRPMGDEDLIAFGKHRGTALKDVPASYLLWLLSQSWAKKNHSGLYEYAKSGRKHLENEARAMR